MTEKNKDQSDNKDQSVSKNSWMNWSDIRSGKHMKGWPGEPETTGDPYDPNNMERTDAAVIINKGRTLLNLTAFISAKTVSSRRRAIILATGIFWIVFVGSILSNANYSSFDDFYTSLEFSIPKIPSFSASESDYESSPEDTRGMQAVQLLDHHYSNSDQGFAQSYDIQNIIARHQAIKNVCGRKDLMECYGEMEIADIADAFGKAAEDKNDYKSSTFYDLSNPNKTLEEALALSKHGINGALGKPENGAWGEEEKSRFCASTTRAYLETRHHSDTAKAISSVTRRWEGAGEEGGSKFELNHIPVANTFSDLVAHKVRNNNDCEINDIVALPVRSGAIKYLISFAGRGYSHNSGARVGTALYVLAELDDRNIMFKAACNNCGMTGLGDSVNIERSPLNSVDKSASGVIKSIRKSKLETDISKLNNNEGV